MEGGEGMEDDYGDPCARGCPQAPAKRYRIRYADGSELVTYLCRECEEMQVYQEPWRGVVEKIEEPLPPREDDLPF
jgi:hypothetical protein